MKTKSNRQNATLENRIIGAEIRNALVNEGISLKREVETGIEGLIESVMLLKSRFDGSDVERALCEGDLVDAEYHLLSCFEIVQGSLSILEQHVAQLTAALVEFRIRHRTVMKVVEKFAGRDTNELLITNSNGHLHLPVVVED